MVVAYVEVVPLRCNIFTPYSFTYFASFASLFKIETHLLCCKWEIFGCVENVLRYFALEFLQNEYNLLSLFAYWPLLWAISLTGRNHIFPYFWNVAETCNSMFPLCFNMHKKWSGSVVYAATETRENVTKPVTETQVIRGVSRTV